MKKNLKKIIFVFLTLLFAVFINACGKEEKLTKEEIIEKFIETSKNIKSTDMISKMTVTEENVENPMNFGFSLDASIILEPVMMKLTMEMPSQNQKIVAYIKDEYIYLLSPFNNQWTKQINTKMNEYLKNYITETNEVYEIMKKDIDKIEIEESDKHYILTISEASEFFEDLMKKQISQINVQNLEELEKINVMEVFAKYTVDKKTFLTTSAYTSFYILIDGVKTKIETDTEFKNINKVKEIKLPKEALDAREIN